MNAGSLFTGDGQLDFGLHLAGIEHSWLCESDPWRREILAKRWPGVPIFDDVRAVDGTAPRVDLLVGGFPCRGASTAGDRTGLEHPETALWREMDRIAGELRPRLLLLENVANLLAVDGGRAWGEVVGDLESLGYVGAWDCLPAAAFGAPHLRDRVFAVAAHPDGSGELGDGGLGCQQDGRSDVGGGLAPDPDQPRAHPHPASRRSRAAVSQRDSSPADAAGPDRQGTHGGRSTLGRAEGVDRNDWGDYRAAVERWEEVAGPAPEPLLRGVDARPARRVVRSRLSALGDGVQLEAGLFLGRRILDYERGGLT